MNEPQVEWQEHPYYKGKYGSKDVELFVLTGTIYFPLTKKSKVFKSFYYPNEPKDKEHAQANILNQIDNYFEKAEKLKEINDKELLTELGKRIKLGKIKGNSIDYTCCYGYNNLYTGRTQGTYAFWKPEFQLFLSDGEIKENKIDDNPKIEGQDEHETATK